MKDLVIRAAQPTDLDGAAAALADAFTDDPTFGYIPVAERPARLRAFMAQEVTHGWVVDVAVDGDRVLGAGLWQPPDGTGGSLGGRLRYMMGVAQALGRHTPRAAGIEWRLARHRPPFAHWFLGYIGVSATAQGRGVGRALLEHRLASIEGPVYLDAATDRAAALYRRLGFVDMGRYSGDYLPAVGMWRPASPRSADS